MSLETPLSRFALSVSHEREGLKRTAWNGTTLGSPQSTDWRVQDKFNRVKYISNTPNYFIQRRAFSVTAPEIGLFGVSCLLESTN
ncbi:MAG: hypothetical protein QOI87_1726 [Bradyrhizobium sp.]|nr:hypothetical protein [Bradyrhizobium sp.]